MGVNMKNATLSGCFFILLCLFAWCAQPTVAFSGQFLNISTGKQVYVQAEPIYILYTLRGLESNTSLNLTVSLRMPDDRLIYMGADGVFGQANPIWLVQSWPFTSIILNDGAFPVMVSPEITLMQGKYTISSAIYNAYTQTLVDFDEHDFYLVSKPYLSGIEPTQGITGDLLVLRGEGFGTEVNKVKIMVGDREATIMELANEEIKTWVPYGAVTGKVSVTVDGAASNSMDFKVGPYIESLSATVASPGGSITIKGFNFDLDKTRNFVYFNGIRGTVQTASATQLKVLVPDGNTGPVSVVVNGMTSNTTNMTITPVVEAIEPQKGDINDVVMITGKNFSPTLTNNYVLFNSGATNEMAATVLDATSTRLLVKAPASETGAIKVYTDGQAAQGTPTFTYPPEVYSVTPQQILAGDSIVITGKNFSATKSMNAVAIGNETLTITAAEAKKLTARTSPTTPSGKLSVTVNGSTSSAETFITVYANPVLQSMAPSTVAAGDTKTTIEINGTGFVASATTVELIGSKTYQLVPTIASYNSLTFKLLATIPAGTYQVRIARTLDGKTLYSNTTNLVVN